MATRLAIATCREYADLSDDDRPILTRLAAAGIDARAVPWDADAPWGGFAAVLLRSVWDYWLRPSEFLRWLGHLEAHGVPCWNPVPLVRWNLDKRYLRELAAKGVETLPTLWVEPDVAPAEAAARIAATGWTEVVVKPTVSAGAWRTHRLRAAEAPHRLDELRDVLAGGGLVAQPFAREVVEQGEISLLFFAGTFSHAVQKRPRPGDFRVQGVHGGTGTPLAPPDGIVSQARRALAAAPSPGLYARVDGIVRDGRFLLMELEQIEPYLFLADAPGALDRFVDALRARI